MEDARDIPFVDKCGFYSLYYAVVSTLVTVSTTQRNLSDEVRQLHLSMGTDANFKGSLILCPFSKIIVVGSPLEPGISQTMGSWPD